MERCTCEASARRRHCIEMYIECWGNAQSTTGYLKRPSAVQNIEIEAKFKVCRAYVEWLMYVCGGESEG